MRRIRSIARYQNTKKIKDYRVLPYLQVSTRTPKKAHWWSEPAPFVFDPPRMEIGQLVGAFVGPDAIG